MSQNIVFDDFATGYVDICTEVTGFGDIVSPRGQKTAEILDYSFCLTDPRKGLPVGTGRKLHTAVGCAEALQLISGESYPALMSRITQNFDTFKDGEVLAGAYGPRLRVQLPNVISLITDDPDTRQAVATIYDPLYDRERKDIPCTIAMQWTVRHGQLNMHVRMRSNDVWWGLPYDVFQFTQLQLSMASVLELDVGSYYHTATSMHAYERDWDKISQLRHATVTTDGAEWFSPLVTLRNWGDFSPSWNIVAEAADILLSTPEGTHLQWLDQWDGSHFWYLNKLAPYVRKG